MTHFRMYTVSCKLEGEGNDEECDIMTRVDLCHVIHRLLLPSSPVINASLLFSLLYAIRMAAEVGQGAYKAINVPDAVRITRGALAEQQLSLSLAVAALFLILLAASGQADYLCDANDAKRDEIKVAVRTVFHRQLRKSASPVPQ